MRPVGRCASDLINYTSFLIFQMTAIKEGLTKFYGVTPKIQCLPPEEVKTNTHTQSLCHFQTNTHFLSKNKNSEKSAACLKRFEPSSLARML